MISMILLLISSVSGFSSTALAADGDDCIKLLNPSQEYNFSEHLAFLWKGAPAYSPAVTFSWPDFKQLIESDYANPGQDRHPRNLEEVLASIEALCRRSETLPDALADDVTNQNSKNIERWLNVLLSGGKSFRTGLSGLQMENVLSGLYLRAQGNPRPPWENSNLTALDSLFGGISRRLAEQFATEGIKKTSKLLGFGRDSQAEDGVRKSLHLNQVIPSLVNLINAALAVPGNFRWIRFSDKTMERATIYGADDVKSDLLKALKKAGYPEHRYAQVRLLLASASAVLVVYDLAEISAEITGDRWLSVSQKLNLETNSDSLTRTIRNYGRFHFGSNRQAEDPALSQALFDAWLADYRDDHGKDPSTMSPEYIRTYKDFIGSK